MAKIFRRPRQKFLSNNKIKKYLVYATGEIILVVIGILIALQINSANQDRQRAKLEKTLLGQVKFEILEIYSDAWRDVGILEMGNRSHDRIIKYIKEDKPYADSMCFDFYWLTMDEYIYPTNAAYSRIKEEGLDIIQDDSIRIALQALYEGYFPRLAKNNSFTPDISNTFNEYYLNSFSPNTDLSLEFNYLLEDDTVGGKIFSDVSYLFPSVDNLSNEKRTIGYIPLDYASLKKDSKFHMLLDKTKRYRNIKRRHYATVKFIIKYVMSRIEKELEQSS